MLWKLETSDRAFITSREWSGSHTGRGLSPLCSQCYLFIHGLHAPREEFKLHSKTFCCLPSATFHCDKTDSTLKPVNRFLGNCLEFLPSLPHQKHLFIWCSLPNLIRERIRNLKLLTAMAGQSQHDSWRSWSHFTGRLNCSSKSSESQYTPLLQIFFFRVCVCTFMYLLDPPKAFSALKTILIRTQW